ncbi:MAG TPA: GMC oxidoreductase, partial [Puia sp.]|nr:GMC oxidoreductase [Puia sp.]
YRGRVWGEYKGFNDQYYFGRRPTGVYVPRFRNLNDKKEKDFIRGYAYACGGSRERGDDRTEVMIGKDMKDQLSVPGNWSFSMTGMGECLPDARNQVTLSRDQKDRWGIPLLETLVAAKSIDLIKQANSEMMERAGFVNIQQYDTLQAPGLGIHEMGTARMGRESKSSVLNAHNQVWGAPNVFVTDGACMTSGACQNPSLTYMAITARAADYAVQETKKGNL